MAGTTTWDNRLAQLLSIFFHPAHSFLYVIILAGEISLELFCEAYLLPIVSIYAALKYLGNFRWNYLTHSQRQLTYFIQLLWQFFALSRIVNSPATIFSLWASCLTLTMLIAVGFWKKPSLHIAGNIILLGAIWQFELLNCWQTTLPVLILVAVAWARLRVNAHTHLELIEGTAIGVMAFLLVVVLFFERF